MANSAFDHAAALSIPSSTTQYGLVTWDSNNGGGLLSSSVVLSTGGALSTLTSLVVDNITIDGTSITTTASNNAINLTPHGTGAVVISKTSTPTLLLTNSGNSNAITLNTGTTAANYTITMPTAAPAAGKFLKTTDGSTTQLEWGDAAGGAAISGTPANNQVAVWTNATTIEGDSEFTWTESVLTVKQGASGGASGYNAKLIVESNTHAGISILAPDNSEMNLTFASPSQAQLAGIVANYNSNSEYMSWVVAGAEKLRIQSTGDVGIGTTSPAAKLHVLTGNDNAILLESSNDNYYQFTMRNTTHTTNTHAKLIMHCYQDFVLINNARYDSQGTGAYLNLNCNAAVGIGTNSPSSSYKLDVGGSVHGSSHPTSSDERLKTNITELTGVLPKLANIRAVKFNWDTTNVSEERAKGYGTALEIGMIAQDIEAEFPEIITKWLDGDEGHAADNEFRAVEYGRFTSILLAAIKELKAEIDELKG